MSREKPQPLLFSSEESAHLRRLVYQAWELKENRSPYFEDACREIAAWYEGTLPDRLEREAKGKAA